MTAERVCVREVVIQLDSSFEELERCLVFLLETVAITYDTPRLRGKQRLLKCLIRQEDECVLVLQVPETGRVVL